LFDNEGSFQDTAHADPRNDRN